MKKTLIMGILNITPDSFSDGGNFFEKNLAINHAKKLKNFGADIIDIGAESTRPGFEKISVDEEIFRLKKIFPAIKNIFEKISIDTYKPEVAEFALKNGANIINDVSGLSDKKILEIAKKYSAQIIVMHNRKFFGNVIEDIKNFFMEILKICRENNFDEKKIIFDPGIGFNKNFDENIFVLKNLRELRKSVENKILLGASRKSFIGQATGFDIKNRDEATGAVCVLAISQGVDILRVHNVEMISKMCKIADVII